MSPITELTINVISMILAIAYNIYVFSAMFIGLCKLFQRVRPLFNVLWYYSKWPALACVITDPVFTIMIKGGLKWYHAPLTVLNGVVWWFYRNHGDDDEHKKLKKKLNEKVKLMNGKLVVVPVPVPA